MNLTLRFSLILACSVSALFITAAPSHAEAADPSYLFGRDPQEAFGRAAEEESPRFRNDLRKFQGARYNELLTDWGSTEPRQSLYLIKDDDVASDFANIFLRHISLEKGNLMKLYGLSNREYNRLAAMSFGILGRESKFGTSRRYYWKEKLPDFAIVTLKSNVAVARAIRDTLWGAVTFTKPKINMTISPASSGPTQIKQVPWKIRQNYCIIEEDLSDARNAAVATMGFLAEALREVRQRVKNRSLTSIDDENVYDYVLYVYTGRIRQGLKDPSRVPFNPYIKSVKQYMRALTLLERDTVTPLRAVAPTCQVSSLPH